MKEYSVAMSYPVNQKINSYPSSAGLPAVPVQDIDAEKIKEGVNNTIENQNNLVTQAVKKEEKDQLATNILTIPIWFGIAKSMEKFNKACATRSDGKKSLLENVRDFGDGLGKPFLGERFKKVAEISGGAKKAISAFIRKVPILNAVFNTPAKPKSTMAAMMKGGTLHEAAMDVKELVEAFVTNADGKTFNYKNLEALELTEAEFEKIKAEPYNYIQKLIKICDDRAKVCKEGVDDFIQLANVNTGACPPVKNIVKKIIGEKAYIFFFGREIRWSECRDKLKALQGLKGEFGQTPIGKILPKYFLRCMEGFTNRTVGGNIAILFQAGCWATALIRAYQAWKSCNAGAEDKPKASKPGRKDKPETSKVNAKGKSNKALEAFRTFMESTVNDLSYYILIPVGMGILYAAGGLKYIGMSEAEVDKYRDTLNSFNKKTEENLLASKKEWKKGVKELKNMLKGDTKLNPKVDGVGKTVWKSIKNIVYKPLKAVGTLLSTGLEPKMVYCGADANAFEKFSKSLFDLTKKIPNPLSGANGFSAKGVIGGALRFILYMAVISPPLVKLVVKGCHKVFGKPEKSLLDEDKEENVKEQKHVPQLVMPVQDDQTKTRPEPSSVIQQPVKRKNLIEMYNAKRLAYKPAAPVKRENLIDKYKTQPNVQKSMVTESQEPVRTYIPSSAGVEVDDSEDKEKNDKLIALLNKKADAAEKAASKYL